MVELSYPFGPKMALTLACHVGVVVAMMMIKKTTTTTTTTLLLLVYVRTAVLAQLNSRKVLRLDSEKRIITGE